MKKSTKAFLTVLMVVIMLCAYCTSAYASDADAGISPRMDNCVEYTMAFNVIDPGVAEFLVDYIGESDSFVQAKLTVSFEKKYLGLFWRDVDIGTSTNTWIGISSDLYGFFTDSIPVSDGTGTYRANFILKMYGSDGSVDILEHSIECRYE